MSNWTLVQSAAPSVEPVSLTEAKSQCRVDISTDDTLITLLIKVTRQAAENFLRRALITQTWKLILDEFPAEDEILLPLPPLQSVTSIVYKDEDGDSNTFASSNYRVGANSEPGRIKLVSGVSWPSDTLYELEAVTVTYKCGYGDAAANVPDAIRQGMLLLIGHLYENRESVVLAVSVAELPQSVEYLWWPYRALKFEWS